MYSSDGIRVSLSVNHIKRFCSAQQLGALFKEGSPVLLAISATKAKTNFPASFVCKRSGIMIKTCGQIDQTIFSLQLFIRNICRWLLGFYKTPCAVIHPPYNFDIFVTKIVRENRSNWKFSEWNGQVVSQPHESTCTIFPRRYFTYFFCGISSYAYPKCRSHCHRLYVQ